MKNIGDMNLYKGKMGELQLIMWDALPNCSEECSIYEDCPYGAVPHKRLKCEMRRRYLESVMGSLDKGIPKKDEMSNLSVGLMIAPLFSHLISFKIFEYSTGHNIMYGKGVHPVYKEIRATIKSINDILRDLGINNKDGKDRGLIDGNSDYYDDMIRKGRVPQP